MSSVGQGSAGQILRAVGTSGTVSYSVATYPSTAGTAGKVLVSDGTNFVSSTPTFPNASAAAGKIIISDSTNWIASTPTFPNSATSTGTILRADGTNWSATTATYPTTTTVSQILYSSSTNVIGGIITANNSIVLTDGSGVPSLGTSLSNDFTFTKATSGATTTLTVSNTSNTASSAANVISQVAGGTAADPTFQSIVSGVTTWSWGADNSDSDAFVIAASATLGTTNTVKVTTGGQMTRALQSSFLAYVNTTINNVTGDATTYTIIFDTETTDRNNDFNLGTSTFTAPVTGLYYLDLGVLLGGGTSMSLSFGQIVTTAATFQRSAALAAGATTSTNVQMNGLFPMTAGDTATFTITATDTGGKVDDVSGVSGAIRRTWVSGWLVA